MITIPKSSVEIIGDDIHFRNSEDMNEKVYPDEVLQFIAAQNDSRRRMANTISFAEPILKRGDDAIIFPNTINIIKGQPGVHKSQLAGTIGSAIFSKAGIENILGFNNITPDQFHVLYVSTERDEDDQFVFALQQMVIKAGYPKEAAPDNFSFGSLKEYDRENKFKTLMKIIEYLRSKTNDHLFIIVDAINDCVQDSDEPGYAKGLVYRMKLALNKINCTFLCIIHENLDSEKGKGHLESELMNESSTVMQLRHEMPVDLFEVIFLKANNRIPDSIWCNYNEDVKDLLLELPSDDLPF